MTTDPPRDPRATDALVETIRDDVARQLARGGPGYVGCIHREHVLDICRDLIDARAQLAEVSAEMIFARGVAENTSEKAERLRAAAEDMRSFIGVMFGLGSDSIIPAIISTPLGIPVKLGEIVTEADAALAESSPLQPQEESK